MVPYGCHGLHGRYGIHGARVRERPWVPGGVRWCSMDAMAAMDAMASMAAMDAMRPLGALRGPVTVRSFRTPVGSHEAP